MEGTSTEFRVALPWELCCADELFVMAESEQDLIERLNQCTKIIWTIHIRE